MISSKTIRERRTIRNFNVSPVSRELVESLLKQAAGLYESDGTPRWRCIYIGTPESRRRLVESMLAKTKESRFGKLIPSKMLDILSRRVAEIPGHLIVMAESGADERESDENFAAACGVMQNFQLLGWERGLGMLWDTDPLIQSELFFTEIGLREGEKFAGILHMGYFDKAPRARKRTPAEQKWTAVRLGGAPHEREFHPPISEQNVLEVLNDAVWAPNDRLREPWRFIFVTGGMADAHAQTVVPGTVPARLLVVVKEEADPHKQEEDFAAACCLVQNFQLLAKSKNWGVRRTRPEWIYDLERRRSFGVKPQERIAAVLELGITGRIPQAPSAAAPVEIGFELPG
ncbi:nitroreductase [Paenibacillus oralis]|uniref:Nitroreductase n=1 Tax=Paenibacillus oralis TaxID=2490856 RepID=A0A3P3U9E7_9BACL|nr:nitroreductase family protein [Paenibacillus oralis]RRJ66189.1 nitroreductase [Paenibacillus oralis]